MPLKVSKLAPKITAKTLNPIKLPATTKTALTGITDCKTIESKKATVAIKTTNGKPTTNKQTVSVKVQIKKLLSMNKEMDFPKLELGAKVIIALLG